MATPQGAKHRDLEQRLLDVEKGLRDLTGASLRRRQLSVTEGDFVVSGGGSVIVRDRGGVSVMYPESIAGDSISTAAYMGDVYDAGTGDYLGTGLLVEDHQGKELLYARTGADGLNGSGLVQAGTGTDQLDKVELYAKQVRLFAGIGYGVEVTDTGTTIYNPCRILHATTGSAANCRIEDDGLIMRVSSSMRYKTDVQDAAVDPAQVLQARGRTWVDKADEGNPDAKRNVGFIAEELHDAGLTEFVEYDAEGRPDAIQYDRLSVALLAVVKSQQTQLDTLSARLGALEAVS